jgi:hypothetical protein
VQRLEGADGVWRDAQGSEVESTVAKDPRRLSWVKGVVGAVQRVGGVLMNAL